jgi:transposase
MECQPINDSEGTMAPRAAIRTDLHEPGDLRRLARGEAVPRAARRMLAIANAMEGMTLTQAARVVGIERQSLGDAIRRYNAEGLAGLYDRPKPGRPRKLTPVQEDALCAAIAVGPDPDVDGISAYTLEDLAELAESRFGVGYHPASMSRVVRRLGFSKQKARPHHPDKDEAAQAAFRGAR